MAGSRKEIIPTLATMRPSRTWGTRRYDPFGGVHGMLLVLHPWCMDKSREFWLRLGVIVGALILMSSAMAAFFS